MGEDEQWITWGIYTYVYSKFVGKQSPIQPELFPEWLDVEIYGMCCLKHKQESESFLKFQFYFVSCSGDHFSKQMVKVGDPTSWKKTYQQLHVNEFGYRKPVVSKFFARNVTCSQIVDDLQLPLGKL